MFEKDVFPVLRHMNIHDITRAHLLDIIAKVEKRDALSAANFHANPLSGTGCKTQHKK